MGSLPHQVNEYQCKGHTMSSYLYWWMHCPNGVKVSLHYIHIIIHFMHKTEGDCVTSA